MKKTTIVAEIGLNYAYGSDTSNFLNNIKCLIDAAVDSGVDYIKFQKRDPESSISKKERNITMTVPWRKEEISFLQYLIDTDLNQDQFSQIDDYCSEKGVQWFASAWDKKSVDFLRKFDTLLPNGKWGTMIKIPSALISNLDLVEYARECSDFLLLSTGMSNQKEIDLAIMTGLPDVVFHTISTIPSKNNELSLDYITYLNHISRGHDFQKSFAVGYSGHESGIITTIAASVIGASWIERHITLDKTLWGNDQSGSVDGKEFIELVKSIRDIESARGGYGARKVAHSELEKRKILR